MSDKFTMSDFEKGLMLAGYISARNDEELREKGVLEMYERMCNQPDFFDLPSIKDIEPKMYFRFDDKGDSISYTK